LWHGQQTWMEEAGISDLLGSKLMGHQLPGMRAVDRHVSLVLPADLKAMLQELRETSLRTRARLSARSSQPSTLRPS
jgi:hypothetical protein